MNNEEYKNKKLEYAYTLAKRKKFFKKARAIVFERNNILLIKVTYPNKEKEEEYLLPGGGVDSNETVKQAVAREAEEEYAVKVKPTKYLGRQYYKVKMNFNGEDFVSNRVEYYYLCEVESYDNDNHFGIDGEFSVNDKIYEKIKISIDELKKISPKKLNHMKEEVYEKLINIFKNL